MRTIRAGPSTPINCARPWACMRPPPWSAAARRCRSAGVLWSRWSRVARWNSPAPPSASIPRLIDDTAADAAELIALLLDADLVAGRPRPRRLPRTSPDPDRSPLRRDGGRLPAPRSARSTDDVQHRRPAGLPRRRRSGPDRAALAGPARSRSGARRTVRQLPPPRRRGHRLGLRPDRGDLRHLCPVHRAAAARRRSRRRLGPDWRWKRRCCAFAAATRWDAPAGLTFGAWADGALPGDRPTYDDLDYHLSTLVPAGPAARVSRGALSRRADR